MKVFISQPMRNLTEEEILQNRKQIIQKVKQHFGENIEVLDTYIKEAAPAILKDDDIYLWYLSKSIELLAQADLVVFGKDWFVNRGCVIEHECTVKYGKKYFYI